MDVNVIAIQGLIYVVFMMGFLALFKRLKKQPVVYREILIQAVIGGAVFMALLALLGRIG
jgi:hypothetical protein